ncbi:hypothetical protein [Winogradskyella schleiferi]|uniref:hypothetical protein n=1 Tax=Winogradskyella schleiferi TaxID=2686078 RepID=UPI0015C16D65|nr:hypothetical protein [Winogradskyella schleiferi]
MKTFALKIIVALFISVISYGQERSKSNNKVALYKVWVNTDTEKVKGFFYAVDETGITLSKTKKIDLETLLFVPAEKINIIKIRKRGSVAKASLVGGLAGAALGYVIGLSGGDDDTGWFSLTKEEKATAGGIVACIPSGIIGALIGSSRKKITIDYKMDNYKKQLGLMEKYSIVYQLGKE